MNKHPLTTIRLSTTRRSLLFLAATAFVLSGSAQPVSLDPHNQHYFLFKGKPTVLISSAEHYGSVINLSINYKVYLDVLHKNHFNLTRIFVGSYLEGNYEEDSRKMHDWKEEQNTLAPRPGRLIVPWARSNDTAYINGGNKFNLDKWDQNYFARLKDFCRQASSRGIVVEIVLFSAYYGAANWHLSPLYFKNNINLKKDIAYPTVFLDSNKSLIHYQTLMVEKIVQEVNAFDNIYFEICNEPYWLLGIPEVNPAIKQQYVSPEIYAWQKKIAATIIETEKKLSKKHLIAQNFANGYLKLQNTDANVSILNFHYAYPPKTVTDNYQLNKPVSFDETAEGLNAPQKRKEAWAFVLNGGAVYNNLDWSFATDDMTGMGKNKWGRQRNGEQTWKQLGMVAKTISNFDFIHARPVDSTYKRGLPPGINIYGLAIPGKSYLIYWIKDKKTEPANWNCPLPKGKYTASWINPADGKIMVKKIVTSPGPISALQIPLFDEDILLQLSTVN